MYAGWSWNNCVKQVFPQLSNAELSVIVEWLIVCFLAVQALRQLVIFNLSVLVACSYSVYNRK